MDGQRSSLNVCYDHWSYQPCMLCQDALTTVFDSFYESRCSDLRHATRHHRSSTWLLCSSLARIHKTLPRGREYICLFMTPAHRTKENTTITSYSLNKEKRIIINLRLDVSEVYLSNPSTPHPTSAQTSTPYPCSSPNSRQ